MNRTSCIAFRPNSPNIVIRRDFLDICENKPCVALVLSQMMYWHEVKVAHRSQAYAANRQARATGRPADQHTDVWVWKKQAELKTELFGTHGERAIADALTYLVDRGFLSERHNPHNQYDRTLQYRFEVETVQGAVDTLPRLAPEIEIVDDGDTPPVAPRLRSRPKNEGAEMRSHSEKEKASVNETAEVQAQKTAPICTDETAFLRQCDRSFAATYSQFCGISKITSEITKPKITTTDHAPAAKTEPDCVSEDRVVASECQNALIDSLVAVGVEPEAASRLVGAHPERICDQIHYLPHRDARDAAALIVGAIKGDWPAPAGFVNVQEAASRRAHEEQIRAETRAKLTADQAERERQKAAFAVAWDALSHEKRGDFERAAWKQLAAGGGPIGTKAKDLLRGDKPSEIMAGNVLCAVFNASLERLVIAEKQL